ncbi:MAG: hypothetical protein U7126_12025 [Microcoleus sp.]
MAKTFAVREVGAWLLSEEWWGITLFRDIEGDRLLSRAKMGWLLMPDACFYWLYCGRTPPVVIWIL